MNTHQPEHQTRTLVVTVFDGMLPSAIWGIRDIIGLGTLAYRWKTETQPVVEPIGLSLDLILASPGGHSIIDGQGGEIKVDRDILDINKADAVLIPGVMPTDEGAPPSANLSTDLKRWFKTQHAHGAIIGASCSGVFLLAETGLLNDRQCTTTWWLNDALEQYYPDCNIAWGNPLITDDRLVTAAGPLSWVDITLHIVTQLMGSSHAEVTADFSVVNLDPHSGRSYMPQGYHRSKDEFVLKAQRCIRASRNRLVTAEVLAEELAMSPRTLQRRIKKVTGESPKDFIDRVRMDQARSLLLNSDRTIQNIALTLGYSNYSVFRRFFLGKAGLTPNDYRKREREISVLQEDTQDA